MKRGLLIACGCVAVLVVAALALDQLFPPDMARYRDASTEVNARDGTLLRAFTTRDGSWRLRTDRRQVETRYIAMMLAAEDRHFYDHPGIDPGAMLRAAGQWTGYGHIVSGGSTVTMQVARLLEPHPRSLIGKVHDILRALQLERRYSKDEILGIYLTLAPFGGNIEGVRAASLAYFGKEPLNLTDAETALLVALPQSPTRRRPDRHPEAATRARDHILQRLAASGAIDMQRAGEAAGTVTARQALQQSLNVPAIRVMARVGPERFIARLRQAGAVLRMPVGKPGLAVVLGGLGINLRDLTMLYVALADGGTMAPLASEEGAAVKETPFLGSLSAYYLRKILEQSPAPDGVMSPYLTQGRAIAFKTGTSYGFRDAWAVGYSGAYTVGVWVGRVEGSPRPGSFGRNTAAPLVFDIFGVLPPENEKTPLKPKDAIETSGNAGLPIALRRLSDVSETRPHLYFPPAAATVDLLHDPDGDAHPVTLRSQGGKEPLRWIVNGEPIKSDGGPELVWRPEGPGFVQVTIIDDSDRSTHSTFRLRATKQD